MSSKLSNISLVFALLALAISAYTLTRDGAVVPGESGPAVSSQEIADLTRRLDRLVDEVEELRARTPEAPLQKTGLAGIPTAEGATAEQLKDLVDDAVDMKARAVTENLRRKENRKPPIEDLAAVLELSKDQIASVESEVIRGQREAYSILESPTANGRNLMDELVEMTAETIASPGKDPGWGKWITRVMTERVPGTDRTYAAEIEDVKKTMRSEFRRVMSKEQIAEFDSWKVDPIEIRGVRSSPQVALEERILNRARELGAKLPEDEKE